MPATSVSFDGPIVEDETGELRFAHFTDPERNRLYLWERKAAPQAS